MTSPLPRGYWSEREEGGGGGGGGGGREEEGGREGGREMEGGREGGRGKEGGREMKGGREGGRGKEGGRKMEEGEGRVIKGDSNIVTTDHLNGGHLNKHHIGYQSSKTRTPLPTPLMYIHVQTFPMLSHNKTHI